MTWTLQWRPAALRDLARLDSPVRARVRDKLKEVLDDPMQHFQRLRGNQVLWKIRVGDLRVIAFLQVTATTVEVWRVAHRSVVYDR